MIDSTIGVVKHTFLSKALIVDIGMQHKALFCLFKSFVIYLLLCFCSQTVSGIFPHQSLSFSPAPFPHMCCDFVHRLYPAFFITEVCHSAQHPALICCCVFVLRLCPAFFLTEACHSTQHRALICCCVFVHRLYPAFFLTEACHSALHRAVHILRQTVQPLQRSGRWPSYFDGGWFWRD